MFEKHFDFVQTPFGKDIPASVLFSSRAFRELTEKLRYAVERAQMMCLTGDIGAGKSTAIRAVAQQLSSALFKFIYVPNPVMMIREMYRDLLRELQINPPWATSDSRRLLRETFCSLRQEGQIPVLVIDEAHCLSPAALEELRMLTNFEMDAYPVFSLILSGHPELSRILSRRGNEALSQRLTLRYHLIGLDKQETKDYVAYHTKLAGAARPIFTEDAIAHLFQFSQGIPRRINALALRGLETAYLQGVQIVDGNIMELVTSETIY
jgi:type II secretory pathway predicted ATPase ExeA